MDNAVGDTGAEILVVEDEQIVALDIRVHLERMGYQVPHTFAAAEEALDYLSTRAATGSVPDLVLMDIRLAGDMDGVEAAQQIREQRGIPVILLTAYADEDTLNRAKISAPFGYIIKPFEERELRTTVVLALYRNRMERAVRTRESLLSGILASIASAVVVTTSEGQVSYANDRAAALFQRKNLEDRRINELIPPGIQSAARDTGGTVRWSPGPYPASVVEVLAIELDTENGGAAGSQLVWVLNDITERVNTERALRQKDSQLAHAERMEAVGRLSGGLAHDFNNLVTIIMGYSRLVLDDLDQYPELTEIRRNVEGVHQTAHRSAQLTRQLLTFSRVQSPSESVVEPDQLVRRSRSMVESIMPEYVDLELSLRAGKAAIQIDPSRLEQILLNLLLNARDAMSQGGEISVSTEVITLNAPLPALTRTLSPGTYILLRVVDSGAGIDSEPLPHVFEPFFTTKESGSGSGFGLATVYSAVQESDGAIDVASTLGRGTSFSIYFPMVRGEEPDETPPLPAGAVYGTESILVVQEEDGMRSLMGSVLRSRGFVPFFARSVGDALLVLERNQEIAAVVSDLSAPMLSPREIVARYRATRDLPVVLVLTGDTVAAGQQATVVKPFEPEELLLVIREALDSA